MTQGHRVWSLINTYRGHNSTVQTLLHMANIIEDNIQQKIQIYNITNTIHSDKPHHHSQNARQITVYLNFTTNK